MNHFNRRDFVLNGAGALAVCSIGPVALSQQASPDSRPAVTAAKVENMLRGQFEGTLTCVRTPESIDGPYYLESSMQRRALTEGRRGIRVRLGITVANAMIEGNTCAPLPGAIVDVWQADAEGLYSNVTADLQADVRGSDTSGATFLRGHQVADDNGYVEFDTIVPGWYIGVMPPPVNVIARTPHVHVKVFHDYKVSTTQLYFPDPFLEEVYANVEPYAAHRLLTLPGHARRYERIRNTEDGTFIADKSDPMRIEREGDGVFAAATIGIVTLGSKGISPLFR